MAAVMNTVRGPSRSRKCPTISWPIEASANTRKASWPIAVADGAMPPRRSSNTLGSAKVVDWKTMLETAVVRNTIIETRSSSALRSAKGAVAAASQPAPGARPGRRDLRPHQKRIGDADQDRDDARHDEGDAPAAVVDEVAGEQRRAGHAQVAQHAVDGDAHAGVLPLLHHDGEADRVVDGGKHADHEQPDADLERRAREGRGDGGTPMPTKNTLIMPSRLHLSAIQPAGSANTPKAKKPGVAYFRRSA